MATCPKCEMSIPDGSRACGYCGAPIRSKWWNAMPWAGHGTATIIVFALWYLIIWPILSFEMFFSLLGAMVGCVPGNCSQFQTPLDDLSNAGLFTFTAAILVL